MSSQHYRNTILMLLCLTCGIVDVIGYLGLGHVFTANMTGNIVLLGLTLGHPEELAVYRFITALLGFIAGTAIAAVITGRDTSKRTWPKSVTWALALEAALCLVYALTAASVSETAVYFHIVLLSVAMGIQTTAARRLSVAGISTTVLTNNLANVVEDVTAQARRWLRRDQTPGLQPDSYLRMLAIVIYCLGAGLGAAGHYWTPLLNSWVPVILMAIVLTMAAAWLHRQTGPVAAHSEGVKR